MNSWSILIALCFVVGSQAAECPPEDLILPCHCSSSEFSFNLICYDDDDNSTVNWNVQATFDYMATVIPDDVVFDYVMFVETLLTEIPEGSIRTVKIKDMYLWDNPNLEFIHPNAFNGSLETLTNLYITGNNRLSNEGPSHSPDDVFSVARQFKNLQIFDLKNDQITSIPENALGSLPYLTNFYFSSNLNSLGSRAFSNLPAIDYISLKYDSELPVAQIFAVDSFEGLQSSVEVNLEHYPFSRLPETTFKPILDNVRRLRVGGLICQGFNCQNIEMDCDEVSEWICQDEIYQEKLFGFFCRKESGFVDIFDYCKRSVKSKSM